MRLNLSKSVRDKGVQMLRQGLAARPVRLTQERELILDGIMTMPGHFGAEDLVFALKKRGRRVSRATVYRTLDLLVGSGLLQRLTLDKTGWQYEVMQGRPPHAHLYCMECGKLMDYPLPGLEDLPARVRRETKFRPHHSVVRICGTCAECQ